LPDQPHCNNPFWKGVGEGDLPPYYEDPNHPDRTDFENHSFIEVYSHGNVWKVIDITHGLQAVGTDHATLIFGQYTRITYLSNAVERGHKTFPATVFERSKHAREGSSLYHFANVSYRYRCTFYKQQSVEGLAGIRALERIASV
jgi:hypothetical protein